MALNADGARRESASPPRQREAVDITGPTKPYRALRSAAHLVNRAYWRVEMQGAPSVPSSGPVIIAPVHRSFMDFFVVSEVTRRKIFYMAKDELWNVALLGRFLDSMGAFPVHREGADRLAMSHAQAVLEAGMVLVVFPEGTRRSGPVVGDLLEGAAFLSARTGAAIVPVGIGGTEAAMPKGKKLVRPVKVKLVVGEPIVPAPRPAGARVRRSELRATSDVLREDLQRLFDLARAAVGDA